MNKEEWNKLLTAARKGDAEAQSDVAIYFDNGYVDKKGNIIVRRDINKAAAWYRRAAENGNAAAQNMLGVLLSSGYGVTKNDKEAIFWTKKAIRAGDETAAFNLAMIYRDQENYKRAFHWVKRSIEMGSEDAYHELGLYYYFGLGVRRSPARAVQCFKKVIKAKLPYVNEWDKQNAMYWLAIAYLQGQGVPQSVKRAKTLFKTANKDNDHEPSHQMLLFLGVAYESAKK